jgi:hypothetical protein
MQSGELIVIGHNRVNITLHNWPSEVRAYFRDRPCDSVPCNPGNSDLLEYEVHVQKSHHSHEKFVLTITWSVSSVREIIWRVQY